MRAAAAIWFDWLLFTALSWLILEVGSIIIAHARGQKNIYDWTLSDTIRRWSGAQRWLAPVVVGVCAGLMFHFFGQSN